MRANSCERAEDFRELIGWPAFVLTAAGFAIWSGVASCDEEDSPQPAKPLVPAHVNLSPEWCPAEQTLPPVPTRVEAVEADVLTLPVGGLEVTAIPALQIGTAVTDTETRIQLVTPQITDTIRLRPAC